MLRLGGLSEVGEYLERIQAEVTVGGIFMTGSLGKITISNFYYAIPAKAVYLLVIPFPWFSGSSFIEIFDQTVQHLNALYFLLLMFLVFISLKNYKDVPSNKNRNLLFMFGLVFFFIPFFMYFPGRRYISIAVPFFIAFILPYLQNNKIIYDGILFSFGIIVVLHLLYFFQYL